MITKGNWLVMGNQRNGHFDFVLPMADNDDFQDNCRLIAAAPDLLAACKMAVSLFQEIGTRLLTSGNVDVIKDIPEHKGDKHGKGSTVDKIQQAIAKAENNT